MTTFVKRLWQRQSLAIGCFRIASAASRRHVYPCSTKQTIATRYSFEVASSPRTASMKIESTPERTGDISVRFRYVVYDVQVYDVSSICLYPDAVSRTIFPTPIRTSFVTANASCTPSVLKSSLPPGVHTFLHVVIHYDSYPSTTSLQ